MKLEELKRTLKPLIKECIKELLLEESGVLAHVIREAISSAAEGRTVLREEREPIYGPVTVREKREKPAPAVPANKEKLNEIRRRMLDAVGKDGYGGVNVFENVTPMTSAPAAGSASSPLAGIAPDDEGVPIDKIFSNAQNWGKIAQGSKARKK